MTISRGQMNRQLYMGGGIMDIVPREPAIFGGIKKAVKKVTKGVKDIASSDLGKMALTAAAAYYAPGIGIKAQGGLAPFLQGAKTGIGNFLLGTPGDMGGRVAGTRFGGLGKLFNKIPGGGITAGIVGSSVLAGLLSKQQMAEIDEADPDERGDIVAEKLRQSLTRLGVSGQELEDRVAQGVSEYTGYTSKAEGGRIGFDEGSPRFNIDDIDFDAMQDIMPKLELEDDKSIPMPKVEEDDILIPGPDGEIKVKPLKGIENLQASVQYELPFEKPLFVVKQAGKFFGVFEQKDGSRILLPMDKSGSRLNLANAGPVLPPDTTQPVNPFGPKPGDFGIEEDIPIKMASNEISIDKIEMLIKRGADNDLIKEFTGASDGVIDQIRDAMKRKNKAGGGIMNRMNFDEGTPGRGLQGLGSLMDEEMVVIIQFDENGQPILKQVPKSSVMPNMKGMPNMEGSENIRRMEKAEGDTASQNAMQAAGIEGLPIRENPKGVKELDLRDNGGFIPPVGIKEKEDDIPAMLSNNEFVFTADAVRGMGDGDVELGAQRMYDQMKMLEKGGRV